MLPLKKRLKPQFNTYLTIMKISNNKKIIKKRFTMKNKRKINKNIMKKLERKKIMVRKLS